jgi:hypothetical protein
MTKKLLLVLDDDVHSSLKQYQIDRSSQDRTTRSLNKLLNELIKSGTSVSVNETAIGILKCAALKKPVHSDVGVKE